MAISNLYPAEGPTLNLNFANSRILDRRITFTRTTGGTYTDRDGLIKYALSDGPRFNHRYINGEVESLGLLIEEGRTNFLPYTQNFSSGWSHIGFASQAVDTTYPNPTGSLETKKLVEEVGNTSNQKVLYRYHDVSDAGGNNQIFSHSCFVKPIGNRHAQLNVHNAGGPARGISVNFNLDDLSTPFSTSISSFASNVSYGAIPYPNGWYRLYVIGNTSSQDSDGTRIAFHIRILDSDGNSDYNGDGSSGLYVYGAQMELGSFQTSYIPTNESEGIRGADNASMVGDNFSDWYNQSEGTFYANSTTNVSPNLFSGSIQPAILYATDGTSNNRIGMFYGPVNSIYTRIVSNGVQYGPSESIIGSINTTKSIISYKTGTNGGGASINGSVVKLSTPNLLPAVNKLVIGIQATSNFGVLNGTISQLTYYPTRLTNAQLQNLTK